MEASTLPGPPAAPRRRRALAVRGRSDADLVEAVRAGDARAFELLYDRHHRGLLAFCRHMLGTREEAEDAVQQVFLSAFSQLRVGTPPATLQPWLYAVARNRCLSVLRARREHADADEHPLATEGLAEAVQRRADLRALLGDLAELPDDQRAALVLAELGDLSHPEIAQVLGCPAPKVKALVFQAREALIGAKRAREVDCREIRETLATATGGVLRRAPLRRHLKLCAGCRAFSDDVVTQRSALALVLPVIPTVALKHASLGGAGATAAAAGGAGGLGALGSGLAAKIGVALAIVGGGVGTVAGVRALEHHGPSQAAAGRPAGPGRALPETSLKPTEFPAVGTAAQRTARHHAVGRRGHPRRRRHGLGQRGHVGHRHAAPAVAIARSRAPAPTARPPVRSVRSAPPTRRIASAPTVRRPKSPKVKAVTPTRKVRTPPIVTPPPAPAPAPTPVTSHGHGHGHDGGHGHGGGDHPGD